MCYYGGENRPKSLAAEYKIRYICKSLNEIGYPVEVVSACSSITGWWSNASTENILDKTVVKYFSSFGSEFAIKRILSRWWTKSMMFTYLLRKLKKQDNVIVYHSLGYMGMIRLLKRMIGFNLILEFEEVYGDVFNNLKVAKKEIEFAHLANSYIFPTELLNISVNDGNRPHSIIYGSYNTPTKTKAKFNDGRIHILYSGSFDSRKGGALMAVETARFLPGNYHLHISGAGSQHDTEKVKSRIVIAAVESKCKISFEGCLPEKEYTELLQTCHIGLNSFEPSAKFNETSFPSKLLAYLGNGLQVVSIRIPAIEQSAISHVIHYYDEQTPEKIAEAIMKVDLTASFDGRKLLKSLDAQFQNSVSTLFK